MEKLIDNLGIIVVVLLLYACNQNRDQEGNEAEHDTIAVVEDTDTLLSTQPIWQYDHLSDSFVKRDSSRTLSENVHQLIAVLNNKYKGKIEMEYVKRNQDTLFVYIPEALELTEQMGSAGSWAYLGESTYTLSELDGVTFVRFDFEEGSHASPGTYTRETFADRTVVSP